MSETSGEQVTDDETTISPNDLIDATGLDVRGVSVVWADSTDEESRPIPDFFGCSEYEALGMARALVMHLERVCRIDPDDDDEDDGGWEVEPNDDDGSPAGGNLKRVERLLDAV